MPIDPAPAADALRASVASAHDAFAAKLDDIDALSRTVAVTLKDLIAQARALSPLDAFEALPISFADEEARLTRLCEDIALSAQAFAEEAHGRADAAQAALDALAIVALDTDRAKLLDQAAKGLFGPRFFIVPGVVLSQTLRDDGTAQQSDWSAAIAGTDSLLTYLRKELKRLAPVDEWLAGAARVRSRMRHLERLAILSEGFGAAPLKLTAMQIPFVTGDSWLGGEFPAATDLNRDRLLYTAHLQAPWETSKAVYGLLLDEWVETIPNASETTGLAFHFNKPNSEAPQSMLLVVPPVVNGAWNWNDLLDAVNETLDLAKQRAVEPTFLNDTPYARLLPALMFSMAQKEVSIFADLALNNSAVKLERVP
jgi:hypothetical protein